ncbi:hypothetical protein R1flu_020573 [Riccia fluitans]|uniref:Uncharacterized protein n=1 Tax=Riccia fluitans TaxID=41844 RepID=A0ABD1ZNE0_9MARC
MERNSNLQVCRAPKLWLPLLCYDLPSQSLLFLKICYSNKDQISRRNSSRNSRARWFHQWLSRGLTSLQFFFFLGLEFCF